MRTFFKEPIYEYFPYDEVNAVPLIYKLDEDRPFAWLPLLPCWSIQHGGLPSHQTLFSLLEYQVFYVGWKAAPNFIYLIGLNVRCSTTRL